MSAAEDADRMNALDREVMDAGFHGYEGCPLLDPRSEGSCPTPFLCSEKGDCRAAENPPRPALTDIIDGIPDEVFQVAGGFDFTDELALGLNARWRGAQGPVPVSQLDLAWLIDGYVRSRLALRSIVRALHPDTSPDPLTARLVRDEVGESAFRLFCEAIARTTDTSEVTQ